MLRRRTPQSLDPLARSFHRAESRSVSRKLKNPVEIREIATPSSAMFKFLFADLSLENIAAQFIFVGGRKIRYERLVTKFISFCDRNRVSELYQRKEMSDTFLFDPFGIFFSRSSCSGGWKDRATTRALFRHETFDSAPTCPAHFFRNTHTNHSNVTILRPN